MDDPNLAAPHEASRDLVEIKDDDAITIDEALTIATDLSFALGKSTLQRWGKHWREQPGGAVRCVLVTTAGGKIYKLSRQDFEAWVFDQKQNDKSRETPRDLKRPLETPRDLERPRETSREAEEFPNRLKELENENMQLKIDVGVRKQLLERVKDEMDGLRNTTDRLLRENGALQYQILQLAPPPQREVRQDTLSVDNSTRPNEHPSV